VASNNQSNNNLEALETQQPSSELDVAPNQPFAEQAVIGAILSDNEQFDAVGSKLKARDFYNQRHRIIFEAIISLHESRKSIDLVTMKEQLERVGELENVGGIKYIATIQQDTPSTLNAESYAKIVRDNSILRDLLRSAHKIQKMVYDCKDASPQNVLSDAQQVLTELSSTYSLGESVIPMSEPVSEVFQQIDELLTNPKKDPITGVASGFIDLDELTSGFQPSDLIVIAGRPSMGKTALAMNVAEHAAIVDNRTVLIFSLEMQASQLAMRSLSSVSSVDSKAIREGNFGNGIEETRNWENFAQAMEVLSNAPIYIDVTPGITPSEIVTKSRKLKREKQLDLIVIDYLQLMHTKDHNHQNRATELANMTRELKFLAKELNVPIIALSQLNREVENRPNKRPQLADLRESGAIEQDADLVLLVYREEYYKADSKNKGLAEINIAKHRSGATKTIKLVFAHQYTRFDNYADAADYGAISEV